MIRRIKAKLRGVARHQRERLFPDVVTREYRAWMANHSIQRARGFSHQLEPGLLSVITAVWDGSPLRYFRKLAESLAPQINGQQAEWFIVANGCTRPDVLAYLEELEKNDWVNVERVPENRGIVRGLRLCLERARGRYVLPVDADDVLYPDALSLVAAQIRENGYPPILYTDEDKIAGSGIYQPYFKPDWDPVLLANSAYIAHLGVLDRRLALALGAYSDSLAEGSPDWDLFTRFANAGHDAVHIPEVVYSWRIHPDSTADDATVKPYIRSSQEAVLRRFLSWQPAAESFEIQGSDLFGPSASHLRIVRQPTGAIPAVVLAGLNLKTLKDPVADAASRNRFVGLIGAGIQIPCGGRDDDWLWEALGLFELFPDTVMVGGRISNPAGLVVDGPRCFGFGGLCGCPDAGRTLRDPGYFGQMWKQRSVGAISSSLAVLRATDLVRILEQLPLEATIENLGCWVGALALRENRRVIYSPFLHGVDRNAPRVRMSQAEEQSFRTQYPAQSPDRRFYPKPFSLMHGYHIVEEPQQPQY